MLTQEVMLIRDSAKAMWALMKLLDGLMLLAAAAERLIDATFAHDNTRANHDEAGEQLRGRKTLAVGFPAL